MSNNDIKVYCLKYANSKISESMIFDGGDKEKQLQISFSVYLVVTKEKKIMIDAGCYTMPGFDMQKYYSPSFVLRQVGFSADEITDVIITHAHHDHIEAIKYFENAVVHISRQEYEDGKKYIPQNIKVNIFEKEYQLTEQIKILEWCGHSKGSSIVEIKTDDIIHIFAGDECYTNENIIKKHCTGMYVDKEKSIQFVERFCDKKYKVHTCHDISLKTERII